MNWPEFSMNRLEFFMNRGRFSVNWPELMVNRPEFTAICRQITVTSPRSRMMDDRGLRTPG